MWEDSQNINGGRWLLTLDFRKRQEYLDKFWLEVMLCLIGEAFDDDGEIVNGAVVSVRNKADKVGVWLSESTTEKSIIAIGKKLKQRLGIEPHLKIGFEAHQDTQKRAGSAIRNRWFV
jgi:translation initiation factor 4E